MWAIMEKFLLIQIPKKLRDPNWWIFGKDNIWHYTPSVNPTPWNYLHLSNGNRLTSNSALESWVTLGVFPLAVESRRQCFELKATNLKRTPLWKTFLDKNIAAKLAVLMRTLVEKKGIATWSDHWKGTNKTVPSKLIVVNRWKARDLVCKM